MNKRIVPDLNVILPGGEWADIETLDSAPGLMAGRKWAVLAKAKWHRKGGLPVFLKYMLPAGENAGPESKVFLGESHLAGLKTRLEGLKEMGGAVPLVTLHHLAHIADGLLIAMEQVTPLNEMIESGPNRELSLRVLRDLDPEKGQAIKWLHFDICPMNIGVRGDGVCIFIDPESMYQLQEEKFQLSAPAWKPFRAPQAMEDAVHAGWAADKSIDQELATNKMRFEIALVAAECALGPLPDGSLPRDEQSLEKMLGVFNTTDPVNGFWVRELRSMATTGGTRRLQEIANDLAAIPARPRISRKTTESVPPMHSSAVPRAEPAKGTALPTAPGAVEASGDSWEKAWTELQPQIVSLRTGKMHGHHLLAYSEALDRLAAKFPRRRELWLELLLVQISYLKDPGASAETVNKALSQLPDDMALIRFRNIIQKWIQGYQENRHAH